MLCFQSDDEKAFQMALRYWSRDEGEWCESAKSLTEECGLRQHEFARYLKNHAIAYDLSSRCVECGFPAEISSRAAYSSSYDHGSLTYFGYPRQLFCPACVDIVAKRAQQAAQDAEQHNRDLIHEAIIHWRGEGGPDLEDLNLIDAFYLYAILFVVSELGGSDDFGPFKDFGVPVAASLPACTEVFRRLFMKRAIIPSFESPVSAFGFDDVAVISFYPDRVKWMLSINLCAYPVHTLMNALCTRIDAHAASARQEDVEVLWKLVAMSECESELQECANYYSFNDFEIGDKTRHALEYALEKFSIPQVWGVIWSATKHAASFLQSKASSGKRHAMNTIPGNIIRFVDHATQNNWTVYARTRKHWATEPFLTSLFFNRLLVGYPNGFRTITSATIREICQAHASKNSP